MATPTMMSRIVTVMAFVALALAALGVGLAAAAFGLGGLRAVLYGITPGDPLTFVVAGGVVAVMGLLAAYLPARRVSRLDPSRVIHEAQP